jgi:transcriptional regulator with XRE-family HTH domain
MATIITTRFDKEEMARLRKEAGTFVKSLREEVGLTQLKLATTLGYSYYSYVSQIEAGVNRIPSESYEDWARVLKVDAAWFAFSLMKFYDPFTFKLLKRHVKLDRSV